MIGVTLRMNRMSAGISLEELARYAEIDEQKLIAYEMGLLPVPLPELEMLVVALNISMRDFRDYSGPVNGKLVGIAICDHPANLRHPTYWHVRNYGLMTANPFGISHFRGDKTLDGSYRLEAGGTLTFRYRVLFHAGDSRIANITEKYHDFITPPVVESP